MPDAERVTFGQVHVEIDRVQPAGRARKMERLADADVLQDSVQQDCTAAAIQRRR